MFDVAGSTADEQVSRLNSNEFVSDGKLQVDEDGNVLKLCIAGGTMVDAKGDSIGDVKVGSK